MTKNKVAKSRAIKGFFTVLGMNKSKKVNTYVSINIKILDFLSTV